jgi:hypothetical protein
MRCTSFSESEGRCKCRRLGHGLRGFVTVAFPSVGDSRAKVSGHVAATACKAVSMVPNWDVAAEMTVSDHCGMSDCSVAVTRESSIQADGISEGLRRRGSTLIPSSTDCGRERTAKMIKSQLFGINYYQRVFLQCQCR